jgi:ribonuclease BN (tRNA processing enzyme)
MNHDPTTIGLRVRSGDRCLAYSADTGPSQDIVSLAREADVFLCEATSPATDPRAPNHLTAEDAGQYARAAEARSLLLTHLWPTFHPSQAAAEAAESFGGEIAVASGGLTVSVGRSG